MISERQLAEHFHSLWHEYCPFLGPSFVRDLNLRSKHRLETPSGALISPIAGIADTSNFDLIAELAFDVGTSAKDITLLSEDEARDLVLRSYDRQLGMGATRSVLLSDAEVDQAIALSRNYSYFFTSIVNRDQVRVRPLLPGYGILN